MAEDWLADVRNHAQDADEAVVAAIVRYCGIALRTRDASLVSFSDPKETERVRENYLKKKLALTDDDAALDAGIARIGERMKADRTKNRVTVYYLLADHFDRLDLFGGTSRSAAVAAVPIAAAAAAAPAAASPVAAMSPPVAQDAPASPLPATGAADRPAAGPMAVSGRGSAADNGGGIYGFAVLAGALVLGVALFAMVAGGMVGRGDNQAATAPNGPTSPADFSNPLPAIVTEASLVASAPTAAAVPAGAGVVAAQREARPMLSVYFDTGKADVTPDFAATAAPLLAYLTANPAATVAISGYNDPSGNAALNAELSKKRAQGVQAALVAAGVDAARTALVKPADTTSIGVSAEAARRVEVTVAG